MRAAEGISLLTRQEDSSFSTLETNLDKSSCFFFSSAYKCFNYGVLVWSCIRPKFKHKEPCALPEEYWREEHHHRETSTFYCQSNSSSSRIASACRSKQPKRLQPYQWRASGQSCRKTGPPLQSERIYCQWCHNTCWGGLTWGCEHGQSGSQHCLQAKKIVRDSEIKWDSQLCEGETHPNHSRRFSSPYQSK